MLGGKPGQRGVLEGQVCSGLFFAGGEALAERVDVGLQVDDLGVAGVVASLAAGGKPLLELLTQAGIGLGAVERGPVDTGFSELKTVIDTDRLAVAFPLRGGWP